MIAKITLAYVGRALTLTIAVLIAADVFCIAPVKAQEETADAPNPSQNEAADEPEPAKAEPTRSEDVEPPRLSLYGTILYGDGDKGVALVRLEGQTKVVSIGVGDDVLGWKVEHIETRQLVLSLDHHLASFALNYAVGSGEQPTAVQQRDKPGDDGERPVFHHRAPRIYERNAKGVLRSHAANIRHANNDE
ncbi:MAG: hypothetical protein WDN46_16295 [Methylocella sp.]